MIEILILIVLSMLIGGAVVQHDGMKGLFIGLAGIALLIAFYSGLKGIVFGAIAVVLLLIIWVIVGDKKPISRLYKSSSENRKIRSKKDDQWVKDLRKSFQDNMASKYGRLENYSKKKEVTN